MNAHSPRRPLAVREITNTACPVEALGRKVAAAQLRLAELDKARLGGSRDLSSERLETELRDFVEASRTRLEYLHAETLAGVYVHALRLGTVIEDAEATGETEICLRRFRRLQALVLEGLERIGALDGNAIGKIDQSVRMNEFRDVLTLAKS